MAPGMLPPEGPPGSPKERYNEESSGPALEKARPVAPNSVARATPPGSQLLAISAWQHFPTGTLRGRTITLS